MRWAQPIKTREPCGDARDEVRFLSRHSSFWLRHADQLSSLKQSVEQTLNGFSYYPEVEWNRFGFRPPEGHPCFSAWRAECGDAFVYLVAEAPAFAATPAFDMRSVERVVLMVTARGESRLEELWERLGSICDRFRRVEETDTTQQRALARRERFTNAYPSARVSAIFGVITVVLNAVSGFIREMPQPKTEFPWLAAAYDLGLMCVHLLSLCALLLAGIFCIAYFWRHLLFMVRYR
jgi:hypothetical protein